MIRHLFIILVYQLVGEVASRAFGLPLPGPVLGMALLAVSMMLYPPLFAAIQGTVNGLLMHLSFLFVPAGVGIIQYLDLLRTSGVQLFITLLISTGLAIAASALAFKFMLKWTGDKEPVQ